MNLNKSSSHEYSGRVTKSKLSLLSGSVTNLIKPVFSVLTLGAWCLSGMANAQVIPYSDHLEIDQANITTHEISSAFIASWHDTTISRLTYSTPSEKNNNFGNNPALNLYSDRAGDARRVLIRFEPDDLPINHLTRQVLLKLPVTQSNTSQVYAMPLTQNWVEGTCNHQYECPVVNGATWATTGTGANWQTPGGDFNATLYEGLVEANSITFNITNLVQSWKNGTNNHGIVIGNIDNWMEVAMTSSEHPDTQPSIVVKNLNLHTLTLANGLAANAPYPNPSYQGATDNTISAITWTSQPESQGNFGRSGMIYLYHSRTDSIRRGLLKFNLNGLGFHSGEQIHSAKLVLTQVQGNTEYISLQPLTTEWAQGSCRDQYHCSVKGGNDGANWHESAPGNHWMVPGGDSTGVKLQASNTNNTFTFNVTEQLQQWLSGETANHGWLILSEHQWMAAQLGSSENSNASVRPKLVIEYY